MGHLWLRPTLMSREELRTCLKNLRDDNVGVYVAMIHSSEIGPNPYFPEEAQIRSFVQRCYDLVEDAVALGARPATMKEVREHYHAE
jgi:hypothetical protein